MACSLLDRLPRGSTLHLINGSGEMARGLAYGTQSAEHLLNVPAARMDIAENMQGDFLAWLHEHAPEVAASPSSFVPRRLYGSYLQTRLHERAANSPDTRFIQHHATVLSVAGSVDEQFELGLAGRQSLNVDRVVLALGNFSPRAPHPCLPLLGEHYVNDPWSGSPLDHLSIDAPVALIGSGLTMLDMLVSLRLRGHRGRILALSRRGLTPKPHRHSETPPPAWSPPAAWLKGPLSVRKRLRDMRRFVAELATDGHDWRDLWAGLREHTTELWQGLDDCSRAQFLRHTQIYWDVHRHRAAPSAYATLSDMIASGQLDQQAGRVIAAERCASGVELWWTPRQGGGTGHFGADLVINCSGPSSVIDASTSPLMARLADAGRLVACSHGLGLMVDERYRLLDARRQPQAGLFYLGPLLKAQFWEATAVPELRRHAAAVARACLTG